MNESKTIESPPLTRAEPGDPASLETGGSVAGAERVIDVSVVGIGASAGGLEALRQLFGNLPDDTGMAFVVIQHLDPDHPSMLASVLAGDVRMPVVEVTDGMRAAPNRVYVIPPHADISIDRGILALVPRSRTRTLHLPIDSFFRVLADEQPGRAIGVVLSGSGSDGTEGLRAIKAAGGITFAQHPESAQFRSMPESALAAGVVDFRLSPRDIASELARLGHDPYLARPPDDDDDVQAGADESRSAEPGILASALAAVRRHTQIDFTGYKRATVMRRMMRRMALRHLASMSAYADLLVQDPGEAKALAEDILIHITSFFRDPAAFEALEQHVFPALRKPDEEKPTIRVWVPGCSTGEEAYSLAICLLESLDGQEHGVSIRIFGSDLSEQAIATARAGFYPESKLERVAPERLSRFFERVEGGYCVSKRVRDLCVFVKHDLTRDPPFARLDLVSCRNVLIYFDAELQRRVMPMLHYCLNKPGYLFLGSSEATGAFGDLFTPLDNEHRIFVKTGESRRLAYPLGPGREPDARTPPFAGLAERRQPAREAQRQADHLLLTRYAPPGVVVNERLEIVQFRGRTGSFLEAPPGQPQLSVLRMAREGLVPHLHEALETARAGTATVRREGVRITEDDGIRVVNLEVVPLAGIAESAERYFLILFEEVAPREAAAAEPSPASPASASTDEEVQRLKAELAATREYLQALIGDHQSATDELGATNEELVAANEELQSINEELESAKEELQSTNEELGTVNDELRNRNQELDLVANDLVNILESVEIPVIIVDRSLRVRRFTPTARAISSLIPGDVGRPIEDVKLKVRVDNLAERIKETIEAVATREWEVQALDGRWFRLQIRPYRTVDNRLDGAILSLVDVGGL
jgi:two-component system CheB/CheR fusion protein